VLQAIDGGQERLDIDVPRAERVLYLLVFTLVLEDSSVIIAIAGSHALLGLEARAQNGTCILERCPLLNLFLGEACQPRAEGDY